jgi:hypothetical protein
MINVDIHDIALHSLAAAAVKKTHPRLWERKTGNELAGLGISNQLKLRQRIAAKGTDELIKAFQYSGASIRDIASLNVAQPAQIVYGGYYLIKNMSLLPKDFSLAKMTNAQDVTNQARRVVNAVSDFIVKNKVKPNNKAAWSVSKIFGAWQEISNGTTRMILPGQGTNLPSGLINWYNASGLNTPTGFDFGSIIPFIIGGGIIAAGAAGAFAATSAATAGGAAVPALPTMATGLPFGAGGGIAAGSGAAAAATAGTIASTASTAASVAGGAKTVADMAKGGTQAATQAVKDTASTIKTGGTLATNVAKTVTNSGILQDAKAIMASVLASKGVDANAAQSQQAINQALSRAQQLASSQLQNGNVGVNPNQQAPASTFAFSKMAPWLVSGGAILLEVMKK